MFNTISLNQKQLDKALETVVDKLYAKTKEEQERAEDTLLNEGYRDERSIADIIHNIKLRLTGIDVENVAQLQYILKIHGKEYKLQLPSFFEAVSYVENYNKGDLAKVLMTKHIFHSDGTRIFEAEWDADSCLSADVLYVVKRLLCIE